MHKHFVLVKFGRNQEEDFNDRIVNFNVNLIEAKIEGEVLASI